MNLLSPNNNKGINGPVKFENRMERCITGGYEIGNIQLHDTVVLNKNPTPVTNILKKLLYLQVNGALEHFSQN